jgi:predicted transport protein
MPDAVEMATLSQIKNLEKSTGKSFDDWVAIARKHGGKHGEIVKFLKEKYGIGHGNANLIAIKAREAAAPAKATGADPADAWFEGKKAHLRPIYDAVAQAARSFGDDVEFSPKKTYMSLRRKKQFGCINPATATRVDVGIGLKNPKPNKRLITEKPGSMFPYRVAVSDVKEVDKELVGWLKRAYDES